LKKKGYTVDEVKAAIEKLENRKALAEEETQDLNDAIKAALANNGVT